jgi:hypothetical protein
MRKLLATTAIGLTLAAGSVGVAMLSPLGSAFADGQGAAATSTAPAGAEAPATDAAKTRRARPALRVARGLFRDAAKVIGVAPKDLRDAVKGGQSIADVATAHNVAPQAVIDKLVADSTARIDKAVTDGKVTQEKADKAKAALATRIPQAVNHHFDGSHKRPAQSAGS